MPNIKTLQRSFAGGEISPEMYGRIDDTKYQSGLATCRNMIAKPQGPVQNRPGFAFVRAVKDSTKKVRLIPFTYSTTQTMVLECGAGYFRFHTQGATLMSGGVPYEITNPYAEADLFDLHYVQSADILTIVHPNYAPRELRRLGATSWTLTTLSVGPKILPPTSGGVGVPITHDYRLTSVGSSGEGARSASYTCSNDLTISGNYNTITFRKNSGAISTNIYKKVGATYAFLGNTTTENFVDTSLLTPDTSIAPPTIGTPAAPTLIVATGNAGIGVTATAYFITSTTVANDTKVVMEYVVTSVADDGVSESVQSAIASCNNNIYVTGDHNTITWGAVGGAKSYNVYKRQGGLFGYIGQTTGTSIVDDNISPDMSKTPPIYDGTFDNTGAYPSAVSYFEQRRCFASTTNDPQTIWMTKSGTESDMSYSLPIRDDDRIKFRVAAREANTIRHIVPLTQLLLLTGAAEWRVTSVNSDAITPTSISVRPQSYIGASNVQPVVINNNLIYGAARGGHVRECAYSWQANGFVSGDLSLRAAHLFDSYDISDMAYAKAPIPLVWMVSTNGKLLGLTYVPEQQIGAWHWHDTDGVFESCAVVAEGGEDFLYCVIRRTVNGSSVRYVERMASRQFVDPADAFFVDCGLTYSGAAVTTIGGLSHLEGKVVNVLTDGAVHPQCVVVSGSITLQYAASKVQVGLPITSDAKTLPVSAQIDNAFGQGRFKNINKAWLRVYRSSGIFIGPDENNLVEAKQRTTEPYGSPPSLKSEEIPIILNPTWADSGAIFIRQADPLPLTLSALTLEVALGS